MSRRGCIAPRNAAFASLPLPALILDATDRYFCELHGSNAEARRLIEGEQFGERLIEESVSVWETERRSDHDQCDASVTGHGPYRVPYGFTGIGPVAPAVRTLFQ